MKVNLKEYELETATDCQEFRGFEVGEIVFDGKKMNGCKCIGIVMAIYNKYGWEYRTNSNGCQCDISKCPDEIAEKALPLLKKGWLAWATPDGDVVDFHKARELGDEKYY